MIKSVVILGLMIVASYVKSESPDKTYESRDTGKSEIVGMQQADNQNDILSAHIDRVEILCLFFGEYHDNSFSVFLSNSELSIVRDDYGGKDTIYIDSDGNKDRLIQYVNQLYIDKTTKIVSKVKQQREEIEGDFPSIQVIGRKGKTQVFKKDVRLRDDLEFTPQFLEFYEFLDSLVEEK